jgi:amino acid transporter
VVVVATILMIAFTAMNLAGAKFMSESNGLVVIWKTAVPLLAIIVIMWLSFHPGNFSAGGGFMPFGAHGIFAALPLGVVFALQGFEQAVRLAGEAKNPQNDMARAVITARMIGACTAARPSQRSVVGYLQIGVSTSPTGASQRAITCSACKTLAHRVAIRIVIGSDLDRSCAGSGYLARRGHRERRT